MAKRAPTKSAIPALDNQASFVDRLNLGALALFQTEDEGVSIEERKRECNEPALEVASATEEQLMSSRYSPRRISLDRIEISSIHQLGRIEVWAPRPLSQRWVCVDLIATPTKKV